MKPRSLKQILDHFGDGDWVCHDALRQNRIVQGVDLDHRTLVQGKVGEGPLFFALQGERSHGLDFANEACAAGAVAIVVSAAELREWKQQRRRAPEELVSLQRLPLWVVGDARRRLGEWAQWMRQEEREQRVAIAVTGSVGKTTVCGYLRGVLEQSLRVHAPRGSFNNDLGVPLTLLNAPPDSEVVICEVGSNAPGEIVELSSWCAPRIAGVTAIAPAHLEGLGSLEGIAEEKFSIARSGAREVWVSAADAMRYSDILARQLQSPDQLRTFAAGTRLQADLEIVERSAATAKTPGEYLLRDHRRQQHHPFTWTPPAVHSLAQLELTLALAHSSVERLSWPQLLSAVETLRLPPLRGDLRPVAGVEFVLDCYNANPASMASALETLKGAAVTGRRVAVVGTMEELGADEDRWHRIVGESLVGIDVVILVGRRAECYRSGLELAGGESTVVSDRDLGGREALQEYLQKILRPGDRALFKASRRERLEEIAEGVMAELSRAHVVNSRSPEILA